MRKPVPQLDDNLTKDEFLRLIGESFQSVIFGTSIQYGDPIINVADIELKVKNVKFYGHLLLRQLMDHFMI